MRRINQTGLSHLVYPGSVHSRFHHALGAMHLMQKALEVLRRKSVFISEEEELAAYIAILLHDVGHGPFSHALEHSIAENIHHENISILMMEQLNQEFDGKLDLAIRIFTNQYDKKFLSQLISSQIDVDRLDYLKRDSFYSGVVEGNINSDRIISMMNVAENQLVIDEKGIYSVEKYLISRMFMYWQVYLHKTSVAAEIYLLQALKRAKELAKQGTNLDATKSLQYFLEKKESEKFDKKDLEVFSQLDDSDVITSLKNWQNHPDKIINNLSRMLVQRELPKAKVFEKPISDEELKRFIKSAEEKLGLAAGKYFVHQTKLKVHPYQTKKSSIQLLLKNGNMIPIQHSERKIMIESLLKKTKKYHLCYLDV